MKLKKLMLTLIMIIVAVMYTSSFYQTYAATSQEEMKMTIKSLHKQGGHSYKVSDKIVYKICEVTDETGNTVNYDHTLYCVRAGVGFGSSTFGSGINTVETYKEEESLDKLIEYANQTESGLLQASSPQESSQMSEDDKKALLWLLDHLYVAPTQNTDIQNAAEKYKNTLLENANIEESELTDEDIDVVQQLAIWHFTNKEQEDYDVSTNGEAEDEATFDIQISTLEGQEANNDWKSLSEEYEDRADQCKQLYNYLVNTAKTEGATYTEPTEQTVKPYTLSKVTKTHKLSDNNEYIIGPFKIEKNTGIDEELIGDLTVKVTNGGTEVEDVKYYTDAEGTGETSEPNKAPIGQDFYIGIPKSSVTELGEVTLTISGSYFETKVKYWSTENAKDQPVVEVEREEKTYTDSDTYVPNGEFDLALRKFIIKVEEKELKENDKYTREPVVDVSPLKQGQDTAIYTHPKTPVQVNEGDKVIYVIRVYNEGDVDGYVDEITDYLPDGLEFVKDSEINKKYGWEVSEETEANGKRTRVSTKITSKNYTATESQEVEDYEDRHSGEEPQDAAGRKLLKAFNKGSEKLDYIDVQIECEVKATAPEVGKVSLKNIAEITGHSSQDGTITNKNPDRDSTPDNLTDQEKDNYGDTSKQDDDDFEDLVLQGKMFDLALRKFIVKVDDKELKKDGKYTREPVVDVSPLKQGKDTAIYEHSKAPVSVSVGSIVTYTLRVYNEGQIDGYADEITDHLPEWLEYVNNEFNASYGWSVSGDGRTVTTDITSPKTKNSANRDIIYADRTTEKDKVLLKHFDGGTTLDYIDVQIQCKVKDTGIAEKITNIAEITKKSDSKGENIPDFDNDSLVKLPSDEDLPEYKDDEIKRGDKYIEGQEDDDDFEKVIVQRFDLSLRKFITGVNDEEITDRIPVFSMDSHGNMSYDHPKTPVLVVNGDIVIYTIRVYNEGNTPGYAEEVKDDLPDGLEYLPLNSTNLEYRWKMYDADGKETTLVSEAKEIRTDYLAKEQEKNSNRDNLLKAFDKETMTQPDHRDLKIAFKVTEPNTSDRILTNIAEITDDRDKDGNPIEDVDSDPDNNDDDEDDIDKEHVKVSYFDLSLEKIVTQYSIERNGKKTVTKTGHKFGVKPEPVVKVELTNSQIKSSIIKFTYQIKVVNEGEIEGYADEIRDYIPEGLKFVAKDNPKWELSEDGKTITTDQLKDTLLKPGESAIVEVVFQWKNGSNNLGLKDNWAEISKDRNDKDVPDKDSTPDNNQKDEDDIDNAEVILSVKTGIGENYIGITGIMLAILTLGIALIKKFVI